MHTLVYETFGLAAFSGIVPLFVRACAHDNVVVLLLAAPVGVVFASATFGAALLAVVDAGSEVDTVFC